MAINLSIHLRAVFTLYEYNLFLSMQSAFRHPAFRFHLHVAIAAVLSFVTADATFASELPADKKQMIVTGVVTDSISGEQLAHVNVFSKDAKKGVVTDSNGVFRLPLKNNRNKVEVEALGYEKRVFTAAQLTGDTCRIMLIPKSMELEEVVVKPKKEKYSKHNNPAVNLMRRIRNTSGLNDPTKEDFYSYDKYEKTVIGLNDFKADLGRKKNATVDFFSAYVDTAVWTGSRVLDMIIKEKTSTRIISTNPNADKEIVKGISGHGIDQAFNQENVHRALEDVLREVDIYDNNITLLQNRFVSPLSTIAADFYKYHITDTVNVGGMECIELSFAPHNPQSMGFNGKIFVAAGDTTMFVKRVSMRVPKDINLNYINNIFISQNFEKDSLGNRHKTLDDMSLELQIVSGTPVIYGRRVTRYRNFSYDIRCDLSSFYGKLGDTFIEDEAYSQPDAYWTLNRMEPLSSAENNLRSMNADNSKLPWLFWTQRVLALLEGGYIKTSKDSKFDFGQLNTFVSFNDVEGARFRLGGLTTANLNPHLFARGYLAYGTTDRKFKYSAELEYSFPRKRYHSREFCRHAIWGSYMYDLDMLGQHYLFTNADNIFLSIKRKKSILVTYRHLAELGYILELPNNFSVKAALRRETQEATHWLPFTYTDGRSDRSYTLSYFRIDLRYAPGEKFIQGRNNRAPLNLDAWILQFTHEFGPNGFLGARFGMNRSELSVRKRLWLSAFGYADFLAKGGIIWNTVPYPTLMWPNANLSYTIQQESYSLMNAMEFANDKYMSWDITYFGNGILFNRIPLIKQLKLRETFTFKGLMGGLSDRNNPAHNNNIYQFPADAHATVMRRTPYMEIGCGIDNILTVLRVDYVWRLTYRDTPGVDRSGIRISLHFSF